MPGAIAGFTIVAADIEAASRSYERYLGYRHGGFELVDAATAVAWRTPKLAGARQACLRPASGHHRFIRFVEAAGAADHLPLRHLGWSAIEIVVRDLDRLAAELAGSPFQTLGPPETLDLDFTDRIRAMQVAGPSGEVLYLTEISGPIPGFDLPAPRSAVDQAFVAVLGASSMETSCRFYAALFGSAASPVTHARIACLSAAHGLPTSTRHALSTVGLPDMSLLEIDAFPPGAAPAARTPCGLPAGIAFASFLAAPGEDPDASSRSLLAGPDGELIEILPATNSNPEGTP